MHGKPAIICLKCVGYYLKRTPSLVALPNFRKQTPYSPGIEEKSSLGLFYHVPDPQNSNVQLRQYSNLK
jgi:hypothetical protein